MISLRTPALRRLRLLAAALVAATVVYGVGSHSHQSGLGDHGDAMQGIGICFVLFAAAAGLAARFMRPPARRDVSWHRWPAFAPPAPRPAGAPPRDSAAWLQRFRN